MKLISSLLLATGLIVICSTITFPQSDLNTIVGYQAGMSVSTGTANTFMGNQAGNKNTTGFKNTFIGNGTGKANTTGYGNTFIGNEVGIANVNGIYNLFMGNASGQANVSGNYNTFFGNGTGTSNTTGEYNTFFGHNSGFNNTTGLRNVFMGQSAGAANTTGGYNIYLGFSAGGGNVGGSFNVELGGGAGYNSQAGEENVFIGHNAGYSTNANFNIAIGSGAGTSNIDGFDNIAIGRNAGTNGTNASTLQNTVTIGSFAQATISNSIILGNNANVGIGTSSPGNKLQITHGTSGNSGLRFTNLTSASTPIGATNQFLTVNSSGDVVLATISSSKGSFRTATDSTTNQNWCLSSAGHLQNTNSGGVIIGQGVTRTPADYNLFVSKGILTEKVKVAVNNTSEWSDHVFESGYELKSLSEVDHYIQINKHLPGIPSAQQMVEKGNDLHKTDAKLLEKIEELTLYLIQQKGELDSLRQQNQQLKNRLDALETKTKH